MRPVRSFVLSSLLAAGCGIGTEGHQRPGGGPGAPAELPDASGVVTLELTAGQQLRLDVDDCWSGQMFSFFGVELFRSPAVGARLRVVDDPVEGVHVVLMGLVPGRKRVALDPRACSTMDARIEHTGNIHNDIRALEGTIRLACSLPDGAGRLTADVQMNDCSFDNRAKQP